MFFEKMHVQEKKILCPVTKIFLRRKIFIYGYMFEIRKKRTFYLLYLLPIIYPMIFVRNKSRKIINRNNLHTFVFD